MRHNLFIQNAQSGDVTSMWVMHMMEQTFVDPLAEHNHTAAEHISVTNDWFLILQNISFIDVLDSHGSMLLFVFQHWARMSSNDQSFCHLCVEILLFLATTEMDCMTDSAHYHALHNDSLTFVHSRCCFDHLLFSRLAWKRQFPIKTITPSESYILLLMDIENSSLNLHRKIFAGIAYSDLSNENVIRSYHVILIKRARSTPMKGKIGHPERVQRRRRHKAVGTTIERNLLIT